MFNFKTLKLTKRCNSESTNSFVGIRRGANNELEFRLPHGFDDFPEDDFDATKELFFKMYRTFQKFERDSTRDILDPRSNGKDQIQKEKDGYRFKNKEDNDVVLYSKIALIENLLDVYRDLALDQMERRIGADEKVDYSKIDRYLDRAIYLPNDVIYIDEMDLPRQTLRYESTTLIDLFCFIVCELQNELAEDIEPRVQELAHRFGEQHLSHEESLFNEETFETTIRTLKGVLDDIDKRTAYKDEDYWRLYEAIETFLYGELDMDNPHEDGTFWGISNFSSVWEDMCATYAFCTFNVLYADTSIIFNGECVANSKSAGYFPIYKKEDFIDPFFMEFRGKKRWMRPDLIQYASTKLVLENHVKIIVKKDYGSRIDFEVKSDSSLFSKKVLDTFCFYLKKSHSPGARFLGENIFKNYPKSELEKQKIEIIKTADYLLEKQKIEIIKTADYFSKKSATSIALQLLDWKYMDLNSFIIYNAKIKIDVIKQLCYEFAIKKLNPKISIESQFVIPWFYSQPNKNIVDFIDSKILYSRLRENKIEVLKANFSKIQQIYLAHD